MYILCIRTYIDKPPDIEFEAASALDRRPDGVKAMTGPGDDVTTHACMHACLRACISHTITYDVHTKCMLTYVRTYIHTFIRNT